MDRCFGIVAEFNPFHNGHAHLIRQARANGASHVLAVMSGNFVQRGGAAIADKRIRAKAALLSGCDLVAELPLPFAMATAQRFALGAVSIMKASGAVDTLCFGSESGDAALLEEAARAVEDEGVACRLPDYLATGVTFAKARQSAVADLFGASVSGCLASPNNILAVEYLRQAKKLGWSPEIFTARRYGSGHDSAAPSGSIASGSYLRARPGELADYVPAGALDIYRDAGEKGLFPADGSRLDAAILAHLRGLDRERLKQLPDLSEGLEDRLYRAIRASGTVAGLEAALKTKRYTMARIRRLIWSAFLGIEAADTAHLPPYLHVLGFNRRGAELLSSMKDSPLPVHTSLLKLERMGGINRRFARLEARSGDLYGLTLPTPAPCGTEYSDSAVILKE